LLISYLKYLFVSKSIFKVHSPFVFDLLRSVLNDDKKPDVFAFVDRLRKEMLKSRTWINFSDFGTKQGRYRVKLSKVACKSSKTPKYGRLLYRLVKYFQPECIIELGTSLGISASYLYLGQDIGNIITTEGCSEIAYIARDNFKRLGFENIRVVNSTFDDFLLNDLKDLERFTFVFIDGNHTKEATIKYFEYFLTRHTNESVFVFDDIHWSYGMEQAWDFIRNHESVTAAIDLYQVGIVLFKKELSRQNFIIRY